MRLTMFYVRGMHKREEFHSNIPAQEPVEAYAIFKEQNPHSVVCEIAALFQFEHEEKSALVTQ